MIVKTPWLRHLRPNAEPGFRLVCFPFAGAGTGIFRQWGAEGVLRDADIWAAQLPGREARLRERAEATFDALVYPLAIAIGALVDDVPLVFFGHSMGALLAYEVARELSARHGTGPAHLVVSAHRAPHLPQRSPRLSALADEDLLASVQEIAGGQEPRELLEVMLPTVRADFTACDAYEWRPGAVASCSITALAGECDPHVRPYEVEAWREHSLLDEFELHVVPGAHLFVRDHGDALMRFAKLPDRSPGLATRIILEGD